MTAGSEAVGTAADYGFRAVDEGVATARVETPQRTATAALSGRITVASDHHGEDHQAPSSPKKAPAARRMRPKPTTAVGRCKGTSDLAQSPWSDPQEASKMSERTSAGNGEENEREQPKNEEDGDERAG